MTTRRFKFGLLPLVVVFLTFATLIPSISGKTITGTKTLSPLEELPISLKMYNEDYLYISGTVTAGEIDITIFDSENYYSRYYYEALWYDRSSYFTASFEAPWTDTFYVVFYNANTVNSATFSYTLELESDFQTGMIVNLILGIGLLGTIIAVNFIGKKEQ